MPHRAAPWLPKDVGGRNKSGHDGYERRPRPRDIAVDIRPSFRYILKNHLAR